LTNKLHQRRFKIRENKVKAAGFRLSNSSFQGLKNEEIPDMVLERLKSLEKKEFHLEEKLLDAVESQIGKEQTTKYKRLILKHTVKAGIEIFPGFLETINKIANEYHLIIVSSTDEDMIINYLRKQKMGEHANLREKFDYVFGKKESSFDWKVVKRKSQLIIKIIDILGVPIDRLIYVGDNNGDFVACKNIGIDFIEARLFSKEVKKAIGRESLIDSDEEREDYFTDWEEFPGKLEKIEQKKQDRLRNL
jgi:phosphoglycolate phosphatase-like HAD superfamily hydrolase